MSDNIVTLAKKFISIKSTSDNPQGLAEILGLALSNFKGYTIETFENNGIKSALIYVAGRRPKKFKVILNGHLDVIPGKEAQYTPRVIGKKLYGVGAMDMKANVACLIEVFKDVARTVNYPLGLQLVTDEEIGGFDGTKYQVRRGVRSDFVVAGEPTNFNIVHKSKGVLWLKIACRGRSAHGAYPWRGDNAIWRMNNFLHLMKKKYPPLTKEKWATTINLSRIETGNRTFNKIPDDCLVEFDIRFVPQDADKILRDIKKILPSGFRLEVVANEPAAYIDARDPYVKQLVGAISSVIKKDVCLRGAHGSSDVRHYSSVQCGGIEFGPIGGNIGADNEWVSIPSLDKYTQILKQFLLSLN